MTGLASIVIPVHNGMPYLPRTVADALAQDYPNLEIVVIDNASTDGTTKFLAGVRDPRLRIVTRTELQSAAANWTQAVLESRGEYVKVVCADDEIEPSILSRQIAELEGHPGAVLAASRRRIVDGEGEILRRAHGLEGLRGEVSGRDAVKACMIAGTNLLGEVAAITFRGDRIRAAMPWDPSLPYVLDLNTYTKVLHEGGAFCDPDVLAAFRVSATSWSSQLLREQPVHFRAWRDGVQHSGWVRLSRLESARAEVGLRLRTWARHAYFARVRRRQERRQSERVPSA